VTLSTFSSSHGWSVLSVLSPLLVLGCALGWMIHHGDPMPSEDNPVVANIDEALAQGDLGLVVMGSSVTMAGVDAEGLAADIIPGRALSLAHRGGQPAHWLATVRHQMSPGSRAPQVILFYVPLHTLDHGELKAKADRRLLVDLLTRADPSLLERGLGADSLGGPWERLQLGRERARAGILASLGRQPVSLLWGDQAVKLATTGQRQTPRDPDERGSVTPGVPTSGSPAVVEPDRVSYAESFLPELIQESHELGARVVFVVPALSADTRRGPACQYNGREQSLVDSILAEGADVVDMSDADIPLQNFETRQHLDSEGRMLLEPLLRQALKSLKLNETAANAPGRLVGCRSGPQ
jgi:hypothetical protein